MSIDSRSHKLDFLDLVRCHLGLDPEAAGRSCDGSQLDHAGFEARGRGIHNILLQALVTCLAVRSGESDTLQLEVDESARAKHYFDGRTANFCLAIGWALSYEYRHTLNLPQLRFRAAVPGKAGSMQSRAAVPQEEVPLSASELSNQVLYATPKRYSRPSESKSDLVRSDPDRLIVPGSQVVREVLGLDPQKVAAIRHDDMLSPGPGGGTDFETSVHAGLSRLIRHAVVQSNTITKSEIGEVRLMAEREASEVLGADKTLANFSVVLACALSERAGSRSLQIVEARGHSARHDAFMLSAAEWALHERSDHAFEVLALLCEDAQHVDEMVVHSRVQSLLQRVRSNGMYMSDLNTRR